MLHHYFEHYLQLILQYFHSHRRLGVFFAFLIAFTESLPLLGTVIPGSITMTAIGTLIGAAILPGYTTFFWASLGAFLGDSVGFYLGYFYHQRIRNIWPFSRHPKILTMGEEFFAKHGGKSILIGRFVGPARSAIPMVAGILRLSPLRFIIAAVPSAVLWALLYLLPGIALGAVALELPPAKAAQFIAIGLIVIVFIWFLFWLIQYFFRTLLRFINRNIDALWQKLSQNHHSHFLIQFITNPQQPDDHQQLTLLLLSLLLLMLFLLLWLSVICHIGIVQLNQPLFYLLQSFHTTWLNHFFLFWTLLFTPSLLACIALTLAIFWVILRQWQILFYFLFIFVLACLVGEFCKFVYYSPRPLGLMQVAASSSFPSGHTLMATVIVGYLSFLMLRLCKPLWHALIYTLAGFIMLCVGLSRIYLGAHWFSDILGSYLLGLSILLLVILIYRCKAKIPINRDFLKARSKSSSLSQKTLIFEHRSAVYIKVNERRSARNRRFMAKIGDFERALKPWQLLLIILFSFTFSGSIYIIKHWEKAEFSYQSYSIKYYITLQQWWENPQNYLPLYRQNRFGAPIQPFNLQWASPLNNIITVLKKRGWKELSDNITVKNTLQRFVSHDLQYHLPFLAWQYLNKKPVLLMIKMAADQETLIELRLWQTNITFMNTGLPLWIGMISLHIPAKHLLSIHHHYVPGSAKLITADLDRTTPIMISKIVYIGPLLQPKNIESLHWDGVVLLVRNHSSSIGSPQ